MRRFFSIVAAVAGAWLLSACSTVGRVQDNAIACEVAIVGGGAAGLHTAYRLGHRLGDRVCLFERSDRLGGRIYDVGKDPGASDGPYVAVGARRMMEGQEVLFKLAEELGLALQKPDEKADLIFARGMYSTNKDDFVKLYPGVKFDAAKGDAETQLLEALLKSDERRRVDQYPDFRSYGEQVIGPAAFQYLRDMSRFRFDFEYPLSARSYLDFLEEEMDVCCQASYPVGGMSSFIRGMEQKARASGVRIFTGETVLAVDRTEGGYTLATGKRRVAGQRVVIAVPPQALERIGGGIVEAIRAQPQFKALVGVRVTTIAQWYDTAWWKDLARVSDGKGVWRAWTTDHCLNFIEMPQEDYAAAQNVVRAVYTDRADCAKMWADLARAGDGELEREVQKGLQHLFASNGVTRPVDVGKAARTFYWDWPDAWYYVRSGVPYSNQDIYDWAVEPLRGEDVALAGEGYNPQRSTWSDGAYKSSIHLLNTRYGMNLPGLQPRAAAR